MRTRVRDDEELEHIYRTHGHRLWRAMLAFTGDREVASDTVAEAFAQALRRGPAIREPLPWLWRACFRIASGELARRRKPLPDPPLAPLEAPDGALQLLEALEKLSHHQRAALLLHHYAGYPVRDVARMIGSTGPSVRVHLSRARKRLREQLEERDA